MSDTLSTELGVDPESLIDPGWRGRRIAVAMSGGVDSSVTAALCVLAGCDVVGITMKLWDYEGVGGDTKRDGRCCTVEAFDQCRAVATLFDFPHYTVDLRDEFESTVIGNFVAEYRRGRTPNPCVICNNEIKWGTFWRKAEAYGCEGMATGHYARLEHSQEGGIKISRGIDSTRDQTYFLWGVERDLLTRTLFPLGELTKDRVREIAAHLNLPNATTPESRDICFVDDGRLDRFLRDRARRDGLPDSPGPIVDQAGRQLGRHDGFEHFTLGQRRGLGVALGHPQYVTDIDAETSTVKIGDNADLMSRRFRVGLINWIGEAPSGPFDSDAQIRYLHQAEPACVTPDGVSGADVEFASPQRAITPGQSAVFYQADRMLGGGIIESVERMK